MSHYRPHRRGTCGSLDYPYTYGRGAIIGEDTRSSRHSTVNGWAPAHGVLSTVRSMDEHPHTVFSAQLGQWMSTRTRCSQHNTVNGWAPAYGVLGRARSMDEHPYTSAKHDQRMNTRTRCSQHSMVNGWAPAHGVLSTARLIGDHWSPE